MSRIGFILTMLVLPYIAEVLAQNASDSIVDSIPMPAVTMKEVNVTARAYKSSSYVFTPEETQWVVTALGEPDFIRYVITLPGVSQGMEGGSGLFVRGGNSGNNRLELNGVPIYGGSHLFGLMSALPADIMKSVDFRTGGIPSSSGNLLSSLTQVSTGPQAGQVKSSVSLSPFFVGGYSGGQLHQSSLWSYQVAGRYSLLQPLCKLVLSGADYRISPFVVDFYGELNYQLHPKHKLSLNAYQSCDQYQLTDCTTGVGFNTSNSMYKIAWQWRLGDHLLLNTYFYDNEFTTGQMQRSKEDGRVVNEVRLNTELSENVLKSIFSSDVRNLRVSGGLECKQQRICPGNKKYTATLAVNNLVKSSYDPIILAFFCDWSYAWKNWKAVWGARETYYRQGNGHFLETDVHANLQYYWSKDIGMEYSFDKMTQFNHVVEGLPTGWSMDLMVPAFAFIPPEKATQHYIGGFYRRNHFCFSLGGYYKTMENLVSYVNAFKIFDTDNTSWEENVCSGQGLSYGLEVQSKITNQRCMVSLSYTLSKSDRCYEKINEGRIFPAKFDRRHILNLLTQWNIVHSETKTQCINVDVALTSGHHATIPVALYDGIVPPFWDTKSGSTNSTMEDNAYSRRLMSSVNGYVLPAYFRVDLGYSFIWMGKHSEKELRLGVYNVLNRRNPYLVFYEGGRWKQLSILPIIPSVSWKIRFQSLPSLSK